MADLGIKVRSYVGAITDLQMTPGANPICEKWILPIFYEYV
jgi:hypothetical protein